MKGAVRVGLPGLIMAAATAFGSADVTRLYDSSTLEYWGQRYQRSTTKILDEVIWPALRADEKMRLNNRKPALEFPTFAESEARNSPLAFYAPGDRPSVVTPVLSLKFLDDLCTAYAWLQINGYRLETISEYAAMLRYADPPRSGFPPPLAALGIPTNALQNQEVDELSLGHFVTARTFILLHEMGHLVYHHRANTYAQSVENEKEADRFAVDVMGRTPLPPLGILVFFMADAQWSNSPAGSSDTHPLTGSRVRALADALRSPGLAEQMRALGTMLDDPDIRAGFVETGKTGNLAALSPRRPGQLPSVNGGTRVSGSESFNGVFRGQLVQFLDPRPIAAQFLLERTGNTVTGRFTFGIGFASINHGTITDNRLYFDWEYGSNYGRGVLEIRQPTGFTGTWGYREAREGAGTLTGVREQ